MEPRECLQIEAKKRRREINRRGHNAASGRNQNVLAQRRGGAEKGKI